MAVANTKSTAVTNADAVPQKPVNAQLMQMKLYAAAATVAVAAADDDNSVYRFFRVHSSWRIHSLEVFNDAITGGSDYNIGVYDTAENDGAAVDDNLFGDAVSMATARVAPLDVLFEALNITEIEKPLWEMLGLTEDSDTWYDIAATGITVGTAAGDISMRAVFGLNG